MFKTESFGTRLPKVISPFCALRILDQPYPFKAGQEWAWKQSDDLYDPNWKATHKRPIDSEGDGGSKKKQKTGDAPIKLLDENNAPLDL